MNLEELRALVKAKIKAMQDLVDANKDGFDEETAKQFDDLKAESETLQADIKRLEELEKTKAEFTEGKGRQTKATKPGSAKPKSKETEELEARGGFDNLAELSMCVMAVRDGEPDDRLKFLGAPSNYHREGGSNDGYMIPPHFSDRIFELMLSEPDLMSLVDLEPTNSNEVQMLADESTAWGATGIQAYWGSEAGKLKRSRIDTEGKSVKLHKLHASVEATDELLEDAPRLNSRLTKGAARALNWKGNEGILYGTGAGQILGLNKSPSKIVVNKESGQAAGTLTPMNIAKMYSRNLNPQRSVWNCSKTILPQLITMTIGNQLIWTPPQEGFKNAPGGFLLGLPILFSQQCEQLGTEGDIQLIDPMGYYMPQKTGGVKFSSTIHLLFDYDMQAFKWTLRVGGQPYLNKPVQPNKGNATESHFITLQTRA